MTNEISRDEPVFQISVVARMVGLHQQTIRSYERIGLVRPARSGGNTRLFSHGDVERLRQVVRLVNDLGVNLAGVDVILRLTRQSEELRGELASVLQELQHAREALREARAELARVKNNNGREEPLASGPGGGDER